MFLDIAASRLNDQCASQAETGKLNNPKVAQQFLIAAEVTQGSSVSKLQDVYPQVYPPSSLPMSTHGRRREEEARNGPLRKGFDMAQGSWSAVVTCKFVELLPQ